MRASTLAVLALALVAAGCGSSGSSSSGSTAKAPVPARAEDFPKANGKTLAQIAAGIAKGPVLAPAVSQLQPGRDRFGFALFDRARKQISDAPVVLYTAPKGGGKASGPYPATSESLKVKPQYRSRSVASDPDSASSLYVAQLPFAKSGRYDVLAVSRLDGRLVAAQNAGGLLDVTATGKVPRVGQKAPVISTPTTAEVGGDVKKIDTRLPPSTLHAQNFKDVVGKKPVILIFATPALCQSRVCGPVVDVTEQVKDQRGGQAAFIQQEIYKDNNLQKGFRPQVLAYNLPTEPWVFAIDRTGKVVARIEGAFSVAELEKAVDKAVKG